MIFGFFAFVGAEFAAVGVRATPMVASNIAYLVSSQ